MFSTRKAMMVPSGIPDIAKTNNPSLVAFYTMDNTSGSTLFDESPKNNDASLINNPSFVSGHLGNAIDLERNSNMDIRRSNYGTPLTTMTFAGWVNVEALSQNISIFNHGNITASDTSPDRIFITSGNSIFISSRDGGAGFDFASWTFGTTNFVFIVGMWQSNGLCECFVDDMTTPLLSYTSTAALQPGSDFAIGTYFPGTINGGFKNSWDGLIDQVRIFDRLVTLGERNDLYNGGVGI
jgi:hypothetical protein